MLQVYKKFTSQVLRSYSILDMIVVPQYLALSRKDSFTHMGSPSV